MQAEYNGFVICDDRGKVDIDVVYGFLRTAYWSENIPRETVEKSVENSLCFSVLRGPQMIGFARVVTDYATVAYLADVFVLPDFRGRGIGVWLVKAILGHKELKGLRRWILITRDAHEIYRRCGFDELATPHRWMEIAVKDAYL